MALLSLVSACSRSSTPPHTLAVAIEADAVTLDPRLAIDAFGNKIAKLIFSGLFRLDEKLQVVPDLASSWEQPNSSTYRIHLKSGVRFHNGRTLTAEDVVASIRSILDGTIASPYRAAYERVKSIDIEDPLTLRITLTEPYAPFLTALCVGIVPFDAHAMGETFGTTPIGTGPYKLVRWERESLIELEAFPESHRGAPATKRLLFHIIKDANIRVLKLMKGDLDLVLNAVPPALLEKVRSERGLDVITMPGTVVAYLGMNLTDKILRHTNVRRALAMGIDRDEIIAHQWQGLAEKAASILPPLNWAYHEGLPIFSYDPESAKRLLDEAGFKDPDGDGGKSRFSLVYKTSTNKDRIDIARLIAHQLEKIGVEVKVEPYEWGTFFRDVKSGNFQLYSLSWVGVSEPDIYYDVFHSSRLPPDGLNRGRYKNEQIDRLTEEARKKVDPEERKTLYADVQKILLEELPLIPMWYETNVLVHRKGLTGVALRPDASFEPFVRIAKD